MKNLFYSKKNLKFKEKKKPQQICVLANTAVGTRFFSVPTHFYFWRPCPLATPASQASNPCIGTEACTWRDHAWFNFLLSLKLLTLSLDSCCVREVRWGHGARRVCGLAVPHSPFCVLPLRCSASVDSWVGF